MSLYRARAPLRLGLAGGGTDVSPFCDLFGGAVLNATISLFAHATLLPATSNSVSFIAQDLGIEEVYPIDAPIPVTSRLPLHRGVYNRMIQDHRGGVREPLTLITHCDAPLGSGLGSSSTVVVAMLRAFQQAWAIDLTPYQLAQLAYSVERGDLGLHGGKQDQYAAAFGGFNFMQFRAHDQVHVEPVALDPNIVLELEASLILFYTGTPRNSAIIIEEESRNVRNRNEPAVDAMHRTREAAFHMKDALLHGDVPAMGHIMKEAWLQKKLMAHGISNPAIDALYEVALREGAYCGKVSGAGGGGFMMFLADPAHRIRIEAALNAIRPRNIVPCRFIQKGAQAWAAR